MAVLPHEGTYSVMYGTLAVPVGAGYRNGYLARPDRAGRFPTVIVVPGAAGITSSIKELCRRLGRHGLAAVAVDPYSGREPGRDAIEGYQNTPDDEVIRDLVEAHQYVQSDDLAWPLADRVGVLGVDVGGRFALITGATRPWAGAVGIVATPLTGDENRTHQVADTLQTMSVPILGVYGADDHLIDRSTVDEAARRAPGGSWIVYAGAGHAFFDEDSDDFDVSAAEDARSRLIGWFQQYLPAAAEETLG